MKNVKGKNSVSTIGRIRLMLMAVGVIPLILYLIINNLIISNSLLNAETKVYEEKLTRLKEHIISRDISLDNVTKALAGRYDIQGYLENGTGNEKWFGEKILSPAMRYHGVKIIILAGKYGEIINTSGINSEMKSKDFQYTGFSPLINGYMDSSSSNQNWLVVYEDDLYKVSSQRIISNNGVLQGVLILGVKITPEYIQKFNIESGWKFFFNINNNIISDDPFLNTKVYQNYFQSSNSNVISHFDHNNMIGKIPLEDINGNTISYLFAVIPRNIFPDINALVYRNGTLVIFLSAGFFIFLGMKFKKNITIPIIRLESQIAKMAENNVLEYVNVNGPDEINRLAASFNNMAQKMKTQRMENELLKEELENDKTNTEFLANISHELRTPLNVILGILQLSELNSLKNKSDDNKVSDRYGKIIRQNCYRLLRMVNNLIDMTKIGSQSFRIHLRNHDIIKIIDNIVAAVKEFIEGKGIQINLYKDIDTKVMACDSEQIERMLLNLLSNAVKFMPEGGIIDINIKDKQDKLLISVKDNGIGIPDAQLSQIFGKFIQVDKSFTRKHEGSGIGLSLVKSIVDLHNGEVSVKSRLKAGSEFIVELPAKLLPVNDKNIKNQTAENEFESNYKEKINIEFSDINI